MDVNNDLCRLGVLLRDATIDIRQACRLATELGHHDAEQDVPDWPAMATLSGQLLAMKETLDQLPAPEIAVAIERAEAYLDDLADKADGQSY